MVATLFAILVTIVIAGWLWFYVARPILVDYGIIQEECVSTYQEDAPFVMSRSMRSEAPSDSLSLQTRPPQTTDQTEDPAARRKKMLDTCTALKRHGFSRDEARALLNPWNIPLDNNVWAHVPPEPQPEYTTPIAGRPTAAQFETDPELAYHPPPD